MHWPGFTDSPSQSNAGWQNADPAAGQGTFGGTTKQVRLGELRVGECGIVIDLDLGDNDDKRLRTLGICPGRRVWLVRPGDPMVLKVMGTRLGLAAELARRVTVEVCDGVCSNPETNPSDGTAGESGASGGAGQ